MSSALIGRKAEVGEQRERGESNWRGLQMLTKNVQTRTEGRKLIWMPFSIDMQPDYGLWPVVFAEEIERSSS